MALTKSTSGTADEIQWVANVPGAVSRLLSDKLGDSLSIDDFGADPTGETSSNAALTAALQDGRRILIPASGKYLLDGAITVPAGSEIVLEGTLLVSADCTLNCDVRTFGAGNITVSTGASCTLRGAFEASQRRVFFGAGTIAGLRYVRPEWWGAVSYSSITETSVDSAPAVKAAVACLMSSADTQGRRQTLEFSSGNYLIGSTIELPVAASFGMLVFGQGKIFSGTRLVGASTFTGERLLSIPGSTDGTQSIVDFYLRDFGLVPQTVGAGPTTLLGIGSGGNHLIGLAESVVEGLYFGSAPRQLELLNTRQIQFRNLGLWNNELSTAGTNIFIEAREYFCGDLTFHNCQTVNSAGISDSRSVYLFANGTWSASDANSGYMIAGIRFTECILYPASQTVYMTALGGSRIEDLFFMNNQWDGSSPCMFYSVSSGAGSRVRDIQIVNNYMYGGNQDSTKAAVQFITSTGGVMGNIRLQGNTIGNAVSRAVNFTSDAVDSIYGVFVEDNWIVDFNNANNPVIEFGKGCSRVQANNNTAGRLNSSALFPYFLQFDNGCHDVICTGNMASGIATQAVVRDLMASTSKVIVNNLPGT